MGHGWPSPRRRRLVVRWPPQEKSLIQFHLAAQCTEGRIRVLFTWRVALDVSPAGSLPIYLGQIPDPRGRQGLRHPMTAMMAAIMRAVLLRARGYAAIAQWAQWVRVQPAAVWHLLAFRRRPSNAERLSSLAVAAAVGRVRAGEPGVGRRLSGRNGVRRVATADAIFCQREVCQEVVDSDGHYFVVVKAKWWGPMLRDDRTVVASAQTTGIHHANGLLGVCLASSSQRGSGSLGPARSANSLNVKNQGDFNSEARTSNRKHSSSFSVSPQSRDHPSISWSSLRAKIRERLQIIQIQYFPYGNETCLFRNSFSNLSKGSGGKIVSP